jgi:hypothetical protein
MALSGPNEMPAYLSAFGAKRTCRVGDELIDETRMTRSGRRPRPPWAPQIDGTQSFDPLT